MRNTKTTVAGSVLSSNRAATMGTSTDIVGLSSQTKYYVGVAACRRHGFLRAELGHVLQRSVVRNTVVSRRHSPAQHARRGGRRHPTTWHRIFGLRSGTTHYLRVASMIDDSGQQVVRLYRYTATATAADTSLPPPTDFQVTDVTSGSVHLSWAALSGAASYVVYEHTTNDIATATEHYPTGTNLSVEARQSSGKHHSWIAFDTGISGGCRSGSPVEATTFSTLSPPT